MNLPTFRNLFLALGLSALATACVCNQQDEMTPMEKTNALKIALTSVFVDNPAKAHEFYTEVLGFQSKEFNPAGHLAIVVSKDNPDGTALLLEPLGLDFAKEYQEKVYASGLPIIIFSVDDVPGKIEELKSKGVEFRDDLTKEAWGLKNMFEDGFGNLIMLSENE